MFGTAHMLILDWIQAGGSGQKTYKQLTAVRNKSAKTNLTPEASGQQTNALISQTIAGTTGQLTSAATLCGTTKFAARWHMWWSCLMTWHAWPTLCMTSRLVVGSVYRTQVTPK